VLVLINTEGTFPAQSAGIKKFVAPLCFFGSTSAIIVVSVSVFVMGSTVLSVSSLPFFYSQCPLCRAICKSGGTRPRALRSQRYCRSSGAL